MPVALITGASRGLGLALALDLGSAGWSLVLDARGAADLLAASAGLDPARTRAVAGDVTDPRHRADLIEAAQDLYAGPWRPKGTFAGAILGGALGAVVGIVMDYGPLSLGIPGLIGGAIVGTWLISEAFIRVTLPLALPGIFAGSLLTFIPAVGDYINAELLGNPQSLMIGNVIQARYLKVTDYPTASALSFILMAAILVGVFLYTRVLGSEELTGAAI